MTGLPERKRGERMRNTLETEIIPRLVLSCRGAKPSRTPRSPAANTNAEAAETARMAQLEQVREFTELLLADDTAEATGYLSALRRDGASLEEIYLGLFGPAACYLGHLWERDIRDFVDVTLGTGRLQQFVWDFSAEFQDFQSPGDSGESDEAVEQRTRDKRRRALLLPIPGEQHTFGLTLMSEFFRRAEWEVRGWPLLEDSELINLVRDEWFALVGISVGGEVSLAGLGSLIRDVRRNSSNRSVGVMVGGPLFVQQPGLAKQVGADATAVDARQAVDQAESLLQLV